MKQRLHLIILLASLVLSGMAQTIGEAFYIYRNDGQFNAFFRDEVDSIAYSYYDLDSVRYEEVVTQLVYTADSIYKIPLAAIDSVGFVTPETQYKPDVIKIDGELRQYVISSDELLVTFSSLIPSTLLPHIGDKLVTLEQSETFPYGFLGKVVSMERDTNGNYIIKCETISMRDVFNCYYGISNITYTENSPLLSRAKGVSNGNGFNNFNPGTFRFKLTQGLDYSLDIIDDFAFGYSNNIFFEFTPKLRVNSFVILPFEGDDNIFVSLSCTGDFHLMEHLEASASLQWSKDWGWKNPVTNQPTLLWPIPNCPLVRFYIEPGIFINASSQISTKMEFTQNYSLVFHYDASLKHGPSLKQIKPRWIPVSKSSSGQVMMTGNISFGGYAEVGFLLQDKDFAHICLRGEIGAELESNAVLLKEDVNTAETSTSVYKRLLDTSIDLNWFYGTKLEGKIWPFSASYNLPLGNKGNIFSLGHVPTFSNVALKEIVSGSLTAEADVSGNLLNPVKVGFALYDGNGNNVATYFAENPYQNKPSKLRYTFTEIGGSHKYTVYPVVKFYDVGMLASPSSDAEMKIDAMTMDAENIDAKSATLVGKLSLFESGMTGSVAFYYGTSPNPIVSGVRINVGTVGSLNSAEFRKTIANFEPNTTYYYAAAYIPDEGEISYGETKSFTTAQPAVEVSTGNVVSVDDYEAEVQGYLSGDVSGLEYGFFYNHTGENGTWYVSKASNLANGQFTSRLQFMENSNIFYKAYAEKDGDLIFGDLKRVERGTSSISLTTESPISVQNDYAVVSAQTSLNSIDGYEYGFFYNFTGLNDKMTHLNTSSDFNNGKFTAKIFFMGNDVFYYQAYLFKDGRYFYGEIKTFDKKDSPATLTCDVEFLCANRVILRGNIGNQDNEYDRWGIECSSSKDFHSSNSMTASVRCENKNYDGSFIAGVKGLKHNTTYYYRTYGYRNNDSKKYTSETMSFTTPDVSSELPGTAVDLGLSVKWADHNIGASLPELEGEKFFWGEVTEYWKSRHFSKTDSQGLIFYNPSDISGTDYDAAHVKWGGNWRMPTSEEFGELISKCTKKKVERQYTYNGYTYSKKGVLFTGPNGNSIFLPFTGYYGEGNYELYNGTPVWKWDYWFVNNDKYGYYWTSTLERLYSAWGYGTDANHMLQDTEYGFCIRPVCINNK